VVADPVYPIANGRTRTLILAQRWLHCEAAIAAYDVRSMARQCISRGKARKRAAKWLRAVFRCFGIGKTRNMARRPVRRGMKPGRVRVSTAGLSTGWRGCVKKLEPGDALTASNMDPLGHRVRVSVVMPYDLRPLLSGYRFGLGV
jgi:hypothetical protein